MEAGFAAGGVEGMRTGGGCFYGCHRGFGLARPKLNRHELVRLMSDSTHPADGNSPSDQRVRDAAASENARKRPTLAPMSSSITAAPMKTRPPMTPLPPLAAKPPPPPEPVAAPARKKGGKLKLGVVLFVVLAAGAGAYYMFVL